MAFKSVFTRQEWTRLVSPALAVAVIYIVAIARPTYLEQRLAKTNLLTLQANIAELNSRKLKLEHSETANTSGAKKSTQLTLASEDLLVASSEAVSPAKLCSHLLACVDKAKLRCVQVLDGTADSKSKDIDLQLDLVGSFEQMSTLLKYVADELDQVSVRSFRMNARSNGEASWQVDFQFHRGYL